MIDYYCPHRGQPAISVAYTPYSYADIIMIHVVDN